MQLGGESAERCTSQISSWRKEWEHRAAWVGSVPQPSPGLCPEAPSQALAAATAAQASPALPITFPVGLPLLAPGLWVHPPIPAGSIPAAGCWLAGPGQEASSLCLTQAEWHHPGVSPGGFQLWSLPHPAWLHRRCTDPNAALCARAGASSTCALPNLPVPGLHLTLLRAQQPVLFLPSPALPA